MTLKSMLLGCLVMALVTYACRVVSMVLLRKKIRNRFVQSFLYYIPYSVLAVMVFPGIFFSTSFLVSGSVGAIVALILAFFKRSLLVVSLASIASVYLVELILNFL